MEQQTITQLNAINRAFYATTADSFDATRGRAWQGWIDLLPHLKPSSTLNSYNVLDVGCGNGRFGVFLAENIGREIEYHGVDNNPRLLEIALDAVSAAPGVSTTVERRDVVESPPAQGKFDLVVLFGVIHHVPGYANRQAFMRSLSQRLKPEGMLVFASWRFYEFERFKERVIAWDDDLADKVERHDYLLDWRRGETALRYCHYVDDAEQDALVEATGLSEIARYRADGYQNRLNCYSVLSS